MAILKNVLRMALLVCAALLRVALYAVPALVVLAFRMLAVAADVEEEQQRDAVPHGYLDKHGTPTEENSSHSQWEAYYPDQAADASAKFP